MIDFILGMALGGMVMLVVMALVKVGAMADRDMEEAYAQELLNEIERLKKEVECEGMENSVRKKLLDQVHIN